MISSMLLKGQGVGDYLGTLHLESQVSALLKIVYTLDRKWKRTVTILHLLHVFIYHCVLLFMLCPHCAQFDRIKVAMETLTFIL